MPSYLWYTNRCLNSKALIEKVEMDKPKRKVIYFEDDKDMVYVNVSRITQLIERYIRQYPHEWGWMHRRWKSRPKTEKQSAQKKSLGEGDVIGQRN